MATYKVLVEGRDVDYEREIEAETAEQAYFRGIDAAKNAPGKETVFHIVDAATGETIETYDFKGERLA